MEGTCDIVVDLGIETSQEGGPCEREQREGCCLVMVIQVYS